VGLLTMVISASVRVGGFGVGMRRTAEPLARLGGEMDKRTEESCHPEHVSKSDSDGDGERRPIWDAWSWPAPPAEREADHMVPKRTSAAIVAEQWSLCGPAELRKEDR
jgi:hypothetical protein